MVCPNRSPFVFGADFPPVCSRAFKGNCVPYLRSPCCRNLLNIFEMTKRFPGSSKIYEKSSTATTFVHNHRTLLSTDKDNRQCNKW